MTTDGIDIKPQPDFAVGRLKAKDCGNAGIKIELHYRGSVDAEFIEPNDVIRFIEWLGTITGIPANFLPLEVIEAMCKVVKKDKTLISKDSTRILVSLSAALHGRTASKKHSSLSARARGR